MSGVARDYYSLVTSQTRGLNKTGGFPSGVVSR